MIIEFNTVYGQVPEKVITQTRNEIMSLIHNSSKIQRVEVTLKHDAYFTTVDNKLCSIKLRGPVDSIIIYTRKETFELAIQEGIKELKKRIKKLMKVKYPELAE